MSRVHSMSKGDPAGRGTVLLAFPTAALWFGVIQNSTQLKSLEMSLTLGLF